MSKKSAKKVAGTLVEDSLFVVDKLGDKAQAKKKAGGKKKQKTESGPTERDLEEILFGGSTFDDHEEPG
jgi:hypothetical protein